MVTAKYSIVSVDFRAKVESVLKLDTSEKVNLKSLDSQ